MTKPQTEGASSGAGYSRVALAIAVAVPLLRFGVDAARGLDFLHFHYLVDDAFYYFSIARHVPYFNPGIPTSGFHPLYALVASAFHGWLPPSAAIVGCLFILAAANAACVWLLHRCLARLFPEPVPLFCAAGWAISNKIYTLSMTGVETILAVLAVLVCLDRFTRLKVEHRFGEARAMAHLGCWIGVAFWARMDAPLLLAPLAAYALVAALRAGQIRAAIALGSLACAIPLVWIVAIWSATGSPFPTSGAAMRVLHAANSPLLTDSAAVALTARAPLRYLNQYFAGAALSIGATGAAIAAWCALFFTRRVRRSAHLAATACVLVLGVVLWAAYYVFYQGAFRSWYALYLAVPVYVLLLPALICVLLAYLPSRGMALATAAGLVFYLSVFSTGGPIAPQEYDKWKAAIAANAHLRGLGDAERIGSFNAGIYNFYTDAEVINLDGVVNPAAMRAHADGTIAAYMKAIGVRYLIEHDPSQASTFRRVFRDPALRFERWVDLSREYEPYRGRIHKRVFLWKVFYRSDSSDRSSGESLRPPYFSRRLKPRGSPFG